MEEPTGSHRLCGEEMMDVGSVCIGARRRRSWSWSQLCTSLCCGSLSSCSDVRFAEMIHEQLKGNVSEYVLSAVSEFYYACYSMLSHSSCLFSTLHASAHKARLCFAFPFSG